MMLLLGFVLSWDGLGLWSFTCYIDWHPSDSSDVWIILLPTFIGAKTTLLEFGDPVVNTSYSLASGFWRSARDCLEMLPHVFCCWLSSVRDVFEYLVLDDRLRFVLLVFAESYRDFFVSLLPLESISVLKLEDLLSRIADGDFWERLWPTWFKRLCECLLLFKFFV